MASPPPASPSPADDPGVAVPTAGEGEPDLGATTRELRAGTRFFGRYTLQRVLGRGGMGVVWLAYDSSLETEVALKFLPEVVVLDEVALRDLKKEALRSRELTHENIVRIHDFVAAEGCASIAMEYVDGTTLARRRLEQPGEVFAVEVLLPWVRQLAEALDYAHGRAQVVHRDLKPANLMITSGGDLKVADFGIAATLSDTATRLSRTLESSSGSPPYMSPQQMLGKRPAVTDDVYAVGATLYELLTGKPPFHSGVIMLQVQTQIPPPMSERRVELLGAEAAAQLPPIPLVWEETLAACLAKEPAARPASVGELYARLSGEKVRPAPGAPAVALPLGRVTAAPATHVASQSQSQPPTQSPARSTHASSPTPVPTPPLAVPPPGPRSWLWVGAGLGAAALALGAWLALRPPSVAPAADDSAPAVVSVPAEPVAGAVAEVAAASTPAAPLVVIPIEGKPWTVPELGLELVPVVAGSFAMGSESGDPDEKPVVRVRIGRAYWLGKYEVTQAEWTALMGGNPSNFKGGRLPVEQVRWEDAMAYCEKLTGREREAGRLPAGYVYTLPTEAEWEYACRAGTTGDFAGTGQMDTWAGFRPTAAT